jgi:hypothetical protein
MQCMSAEAFITCWINTLDRFRTYFYTVLQTTHIWHSICTTAGMLEQYLRELTIDFKLDPIAQKQETHPSFSIIHSPSKDTDMPEHYQLLSSILLFYLDRDIEDEADACRLSRRPLKL